MATRKRSGAAGRAKSSSSRATGIPAGMVEGVQQIWLAGMGALARAQRDGPAAFHDAVTEGLKLLERSRSGAGQLVRDAIDTAQGSMQARIDSAMSQANETWDSLETLFQNRVQRALMQIGVPTAEEVRKLTRRVADLNESVKALSQRQATPRKRGKARAARATRGSTRRRRRA
jgi:poly(hydroxyalkanoate) granule-associated protein